MQARDPVLGIPAPESVKGLGRPPRGGGGCSPLSSGSPKEGLGYDKTLKDMKTKPLLLLHFTVTSQWGGGDIYVLMRERMKGKGCWVP